MRFSQCVCVVLPTSCCYYEISVLVVNVNEKCARVFHRIRNNVTKVHGKKERRQWKYVMLITYLWNGIGLQIFFLFFPKLRWKFPSLQFSLVFSEIANISIINRNHVTGWIKLLNMNTYFVYAHRIHYKLNSLQKVSTNFMHEKFN